MLVTTLNEQAVPIGGSAMIADRGARDVMCEVAGDGDVDLVGWDCGDEPKRKRFRPT